MKLRKLNHGASMLSAMWLFVLLIIVIGGGMFAWHYYHNTSNGELKPKNAEVKETAINKPNSTIKWIKLVSPNGGEIWKIGNNYKVKWRSSGIEKVKISIVDYGAPENCLLNNGNPIPASFGEYNFKLESCKVDKMGMGIVKLSPGDEYKIRIEDAEHPEKYSDFSDNYFSIEE